MNDVVLINLGCGQLLQEDQTAFGIHQDCQNKKAVKYGSETLHNRYHYFNPKLKYEIEMDDYSNEATERLFETAREFIAKNSV